MERKVRTIAGPDLMLDDIAKFNLIHSQIFLNNCSIKNQRELELFFREKIKNLYFILGEDWFLVYSKIHDYINFLLWGAIDIKYIHMV